MKRLAENALKIWFGEKNRKPLILRGARQVGKSTLVRNFAATEGLKLQEINLERNRRLDSVFATLDMKRIMLELANVAGTKIDEPESLLFLDEIQETPHAIAALRYFHEDCPQLPVVAAGSLLEFALDAHDFSMPVGRIQYFHLGPMNFKEYIMSAEPYLVEYLESIRLDSPVSIVAHEKLCRHLRDYFFVGGMPEAVSEYLENQDVRAVSRVQSTILETYIDDFPKYSKSATIPLVETVFKRLPFVAGQKVKFVNYSRENKAAEVRNALRLVEKAKIFTRVSRADCSGVPISSGVDEDFYKPLYLDVGLLNHACGLGWEQFGMLDDIALVNSGIVAEQFVGGQLLNASGGGMKSELFYWVREAKSSNAEVDYVLQKGAELLPVEVKAGKRGTLKSLAQMMGEKRLRRAVRFDMNSQSVFTDDFTLISLPLYAAGEIGTILGDTNGMDVGTEGMLDFKRVD